MSAAPAQVLEGCESGQIGTPAKGEAPETGPEGSNPSPSSTQTNVIIEGWIWDTESGECLGPVLDDGFRIDSLERLDWVFELMGEVEAEIAAIDKTKDVIRAHSILENAEACKKAPRSRLKSLHWKFDKEIEHFAREQLKKQKGKTVQRLLGSVQFTAHKAKLTVEDEQKVARWALAACPETLRAEIDLAEIEDKDTLAALAEIANEVRDAVKKLTFRITLLDPALAARLATLEPMPELSNADEPEKEYLPPGFKVEPAGDTVKISTGVKS